jgi:REP element-mobilizing transposase RayT
MRLRRKLISHIKLKYYLGWITRYRRKILLKGVKNFLKIKLQKIRKYYPKMGILRNRYRF